jgi:hypothetical protein
VTDIHPLGLSSGTRQWRDANEDLYPQESELGAFSGFPEANSRYADEDGPDWPYSDEIVVGIEHEVLSGVRVGAMYYHRTNRSDVAGRNAIVPSNAYTPHTIEVPAPPAGPGGTATLYNLDPAFFGLQENVLDNDALLDTTYDGLEITASKRLSNRWQMLAGLTIGRNEGGSNRGDLNDPNILNNLQGTVGNDSQYSFKLAGGYDAPWDINISGRFIWDDGFPFDPAYIVNRSTFPGLTRASQRIWLTRRGDERLDDITLMDLRISKVIRIGNAMRLTPQFEVFNLANVSTVVSQTEFVGPRYQFPTQIMGPRLVRLGVVFDL